MQKTLLAGAMLILAISSRAQSADRQVIGSSGGSFSGSSLSADHTLGETVIASQSAGSFLLTQGFQQPVANPTGIGEVNPQSVDYRLYPNPATATVTLELNSQTAATMLLSISSVNGQTVYPAERLQLNSSLKKDISISMLAPGVYFLRLTDREGNPLQNIRFVKQ